jgi:hypothetical protein
VLTPLKRFVWKFRKLLVALAYIGGNFADNGREARVSAEPAATELKAFKIVIVPPPLDLVR